MLQLKTLMTQSRLFLACSLSLSLHSLRPALLEDLLLAFCPTLSKNLFVLQTFCLTLL